MNLTVLQNKSVRWLAITVVLDAVFFGFTDPARVAPIWLIIGFTLATLTLYWFFRGVMLILAVYLKVVRKQGRQLARVLTLASALLIAMQSMGQLSLRDVLVLVPLLVVGYSYIRYNHRRPTAN